MNRIDNIAATIGTAANAPKASFATLPLSAQTKVVFSVTNRLYSGIAWWDNIIADEEQSDSFRKRAVSEVHQRERFLPGCLSFIHRASHYSGGKAKELEFQVTSGDIDTGDTSIDSEYDLQIVATHPHAWAKQFLTDKGLWPADFEASDAPLELVSVEKTYRKYCARYIALTLLAQLGLYNPPVREDDDTPSDIVLLGAMSNEMAALSLLNGRALALGIAHLFRKALPTGMMVSQYVEGKQVQTTYTLDDLIGYLKQAVFLDKEDAEAAAEAKAAAEDVAERKALVSDIKSMTRQAITISTVMSTFSACAADMKKAGVSDDMIASMMQQVTARIMPSAPAQAVDPVQPPAPVDTKAEEIAALRAALNKAEEEKLHALKLAEQVEAEKAEAEAALAKAREAARAKKAKGDKKAKPNGKAESNTAMAEAFTKAKH